MTLNTKKAVPKDLIDSLLAALGSVRISQHPGRASASESYLLIWQKKFEFGNPNDSNVAVADI
jgi:hypothetical protein